MKNSKKAVIVCAAAVLWAGGFMAFAQTRPASELRQEARDTRQNVRSEAKDKRQEVRTDLKNTRQEARTEIRNTREGAKEDVKARREELKEQIEAKREEAKKRLEALREETKEKMKAKRDELKKKLEQVRDAKKKERAAKLDEQMNRLNERWTTHFTNVLNKLEEILGKVQLRADKAAALGKDVTAARTAIDVAKAAIASARSAVEVQAQKSYTITFASEEELKAAFKKAKEQLHSDLKALRDGAIKNAREAVHQAARALSGIPRVNDEPEESTTPAPAPTPPSQ